jgi:hypothetical protein
MSELLPAFPLPYCQADLPCERLPCFQARLKAAAGRHCVERRAELCWEHIGDAVHALATWARTQGLEGQVTVLAIDVPTPGQPSPAWGMTGLAFGTVPLGPSHT